MLHLVSRKFYLLKRSDLTLQIVVNWFQQGVECLVVVPPQYFCKFGDVVEIPVAVESQPFLVITAVPTSS